MKTVVRVLSVLVGVAVAAIVVDRLALWIWRYRVNGYFITLKRSAELLKPSRNPNQPTGILSWSGDRDDWQVPLLEVAMEGPRPSHITVDGNGGLNLFYVPPLCAWSRHVPWAYNRNPIQGSDVYPYNDVYIIQIWTLESRPGGKELPYPSVALEHGLPF